MRMSCLLSAGGSIICTACRDRHPKRALRIIPHCTCSHKTFALCMYAALAMQARQLYTNVVPRAVRKHQSHRTSMLVEY